eukprot:gb/GEZN01006352.1/.p1 GENE.gb/GEZN01006352.1/~~gb/GEZN01006352.1/.p1  ORF type:complete len:469 (+),score=76.51 gb/GEZN01006352.1/:48-1454(+)
MHQRSASVAELSPAEMQRMNEEKKTPLRRALYCIFFPITLIYYSVIIYLAPCFIVYFNKAMFKFLCFIFGCCRDCCMHRDNHFPPDNTSLGKWDGKDLNQLDQEVEWKRAHEIFDQMSPCLFADQIEPKDVAQGELGDCWLLSAIACLTEFDGAIRNLFITKQYSARGIYEIRLYNGYHRKFEKVTLDDYLPVKKGTKKPIFANPNGGELWVLLLEKAFAKVFGSYNGIQGGLIITALEALTGDEVMTFKKDKGTWNRMNLVHFKPEPEKPDKPRPVGLRTTEEKHSDQDMWGVVLAYLDRGSVLGAGSIGSSDKKDTHGIVEGHAYSIVNCVEEGEFKMVQLRNPWGTFEWDGDWSDKSQLWQKHSSVKRACGHSDKKEDNDGKFWMVWYDFCQYFQVLHVACRSVGIRDLALDVRETDGCAGPAKGCCVGCLRFYCCCEGARALLCYKISDHRTIAAKKKSCCVIC